MAPNFDGIHDRLDSVTEYLHEQDVAAGEDRRLSAGVYNDLVHLLADWAAYTEMLRELLANSQVSGNTVLGLL